ncbi:MAG: ABC transporter ATP-binding protein [Hyphomicrobiales bacterium]|nr:ABC transporter ATP-binding protein [Hyphomicrobiales bacterium]
MIALEVDIAAKTFLAEGRASHTAIRDMRFTVDHGEFACLVGPSGAGKTSLLNIIAGLDPDYDGVVRVNADADRLCYMFQSPRLLPWRTVAQNVELVMREDGAREAALRLIDEVGLTKFADAFPGQISLGMQRRAALARAFAFRPSILLMDEPFVSLDESAADGLRSLLADLWRSRGCTVLFVTHDTREAVRLATRIIVFTGPPARVAHDIPVRLSTEERADAAAIEAFRARNLALRQAVAQPSNGEIRVESGLV